MGHKVIVIPWFVRMYDAVMHERVCRTSTSQDISCCILGILATM